MKKVLYFHGLGGSGNGLLETKNDWDEKLPELAKHFELIAPNLDYLMLSQNPFSSKFIHYYLQNIEFDVVMGLSMGGYMAYHVSKQYNVPCILFNPALSDITLSHNWHGPWFENSKLPNENIVRVIVSELDPVVNAPKTLEFLKEDCPNCDIRLLPGETEHGIANYMMLFELLEFLNKTELINSDII